MFWRRRGGCINIAVPLIIGSIFLGMALYLWLVAAPDQDNEASHIEGLPGTSLAQYTDLPAGTEVAIRVMLVNNMTLTDDFYDVRTYELVAYKVDEWNVTTDSEGDESGKWHTISHNIPSLTFQFEDAQYTLIREQRGAGLSFSGDLYEFLQRSASGKEASYDGEKLRDGSHRIRGFRDGDTVTVVGTRTAQGDVIPTRLHGGDRQSLVDDIRGEAHQARLVGGLFGCVGGVMLLWLVWGVRSLLRGR